MKKIVNLTQHPASSEQIAQGVFDLTGGRLGALRAELNFDFLPNRAGIEGRADFIAKYAAEVGAESAMIGGAPFLMSALESALRERCITPMYAFSVRESVEIADPETGEVTKTSVFRHLGFVEA